MVEHNVDILGTVKNWLPRDSKKTPNGFWSYNCPVCHIVGSHSPDTRRRGGMRFDLDRMGINCFNCGFKAVWIISSPMPKRIRWYLGHLGAPSDDISALSFLSWANSNVTTETLKPTPVLPTIYPELNLPIGSKLINNIIETEQSIPFLNCLEALSTRSDEAIKNGEFWWCDSVQNNYKDRIILPIRINNKIIGWTARASRPDITKYKTEKPPGAIFNIDKAMANEHILFITEGVFDALVVNGISTMGANVGKEALEWISNNSGQRQIILIPDGDAAGTELMEVASNLNWSVSYPWRSRETTDYSIAQPTWELDIKDADEAAKRYGILYTYDAIMNNIYEHPTQIRNLIGFRLGKNTKGKK